MADGVTMDSKTQVQKKKTQCKCALYLKNECVKYFLGPYKNKANVAAMSKVIFQADVLFETYSQNGLTPLI